MKINKRNRLDSARVVDSPNFSDRLHEEISLLVIHNISLPPGEFGNHFVNDFFTNQLDPTQDPYFEEIHQMKVSSHLFICLLYTSPSPRDVEESRMPSSA